MRISPLLTLGLLAPTVSADHLLVVEPIGEGEPVVARASEDGELAVSGKMAAQP